MMKKKTVSRRTRRGKYDKKYCTELIEFFDVEYTEKSITKYVTAKGTEKTVESEIPAKLPTIHNFCKKIGIGIATFYVWSKKHPEFAEAHEQARENQKDMWLQNSLKGLYPPIFAKYVGANLFGWHEKQDHEIHGDIFIEVVNYAEKKDKNNDPA